MKILKLTLTKDAFDVMLTGEKTQEYRRPSKWIYSRLIDQKTKRNKHIDEVQFTNGYGKDRPVFRAKFLGHRRVLEALDKQYSNGLRVHVPLGSCIIDLGEVTFVDNIQEYCVATPTGPEELRKAMQSYYEKYFTSGLKKELRYCIQEALIGFAISEDTRQYWNGSKAIQLCNTNKHSK